MKAIDLVEVVFSDLETNPKKAELTPYAQLIKYVAEQNPNEEVNPTATAEGLYKAMYEEAKKNKKKNCYCFCPEQSIAFCKKYLGIKDSGNSDKQILHLNAKSQPLNLEDFF